MMSKRIAGWPSLRLLLSAIALCATAGILNSAPPQTAPPSAQTSADVYKAVYNGWKWWHVYCYRCHGTNGVGATLAPSLIEANRQFTLREFLPKVKNGSPDKGMQAWDQLLDDKQITDIYTYVTARADKVLPPGRPDEVGPRGGPWVPPAGWPKPR